MIEAKKTDPKSYLIGRDGWGRAFAAHFCEAADIVSKAEIDNRVSMDTTEKQGMRWARFYGLKNNTTSDFYFEPWTLKKLWTGYDIQVGILVLNIILYGYIWQNLISTLKWGFVYNLRLLEMISINFIMFFRLHMFKILLFNFQ